MDPSGHPDSQARQDARLMAEARSRLPAALGSITSRFGRELTGIAYLVLQHHEAAADAVARGIADVWRRADDPDPLSDVERLRLALLGATARQALLGHRASRAVDPSTDGRPSRLVAGLSPLARAAIALRYAGVAQPEVARLLGVKPVRLSRLLQRGADDGWRLAAAEQLAALPVVVDAGRVRAALAGPNDQPAPRRRWAIQAAATAIVVLMLIGLAAAVDDEAQELPAGQPQEVDVGRQPPGGGGTVIDGGATTLGADSPWSQLWPGRGLVPPFTLQDCYIEPANLPISFAGWVTVEQIRATGVTAPGASLFAIVTRGDAEWIGYRYTHGRPVFPRPVGRLACVFEPGSGTYAAIGVARDWEPPTLADGCAASPITSFAGYRELGGPGAFVLVDTRGPWQADDPELSFLVRVAPAPSAGSSVEAWLQPAGAGPQIPADVGGPAAEADSSLMGYLTVDGIEIPEPGCWVMNVAVDGQVVGAAVLPLVAPGLAMP